MSGELHLRLMSRQISADQCQIYAALCPRGWLNQLADTRECLILLSVQLQLYLSTPKTNSQKYLVCPWRTSSKVAMLWPCCESGLDAAVSQCDIQCR